MTWADTVYWIQLGRIVQVRDNTHSEVVGRRGGKVGQTTGTKDHMIMLHMMLLNIRPPNTGENNIVCIKTHLCAKGWVTNSLLHVHWSQHWKCSSRVYLPLWGRALWGGGWGWGSVRAGVAWPSKQRLKSRTFCVYGAEQQQQQTRELQSSAHSDRPKHQLAPLSLLPRFTRISSASNSVEYADTCVATVSKWKVFGMGFF